MGQKPDDVTTGAYPSGATQPNVAPGSSTSAGTAPPADRGDLPEMRADLDHIRTDISQTIEAIEAKLTPENLAQEAAGQVKSQVQGQKGRVAEQLAIAADALRQTGDQLRGQNQGSLAEYFDQAAGQVNRLSRSVRDRDVGELIGEVQRFARRQPALFVGSAFAIGLIGGRFLKSHGEDSNGSDMMAPTRREWGSAGADIGGPGLEGIHVPTRGDRSF